MSDSQNDRASRRGLGLRRVNAATWWTAAAATAGVFGFGALLSQVPTASAASATTGTGSPQYAPSPPYAGSDTQGQHGLQAPVSPPLSAHHGRSHATTGAS